MGRRTFRRLGRRTFRRMGRKKGRMMGKWRTGWRTGGGWTGRGGYSE